MSNFTSLPRLPSALMRKVDDVIQLFDNTPVMNSGERKRLFDKFHRASVSKMLDEGVSYGEASGAPEFYNQDEQSFRSFIKETDQDLDWQCDTVIDAFDRYQRTGEIPAPHFPMRIAILLRKAKERDRENRFLAAWCRHFPTGNGATYLKLVERAKKAGAI